MPGIALWCDSKKAKTYITSLQHESSACGKVVPGLRGHTHGTRQVHLRFGAADDAWRLAHKHLQLSLHSSLRVCLSQKVLKMQCLKIFLDQGASQTKDARLLLMILSSAFAKYAPMVCVLHAGVRPLDPSSPSPSPPFACNLKTFVSFVLVGAMLYRKQIGTLSEPLP